MHVVKERFKTVLLILLILSSLLLTRVNLFNGLISEAQSEEAEVASTKLSTYINPQSYSVSFGGLSYTKVYDLDLQESIWSEVRPFILSTFVNYESVEQITEKDYTKAFTENSLLIKMPFSLSISEFYSVFSDEVLGDEIANIKPREYLIREGNVRSLYLFDEVNNKYYLLKHKTMKHDVGALIEVIKAQEPVEYRKVNDRYSLPNILDETYNTLNYVLIPVQYNSITSAIKVQNEVRTDDAFFNQDISAFTNAVFGNRLDFVKKLKDVNDSIVLMYGYGDKSLTVTQTGEIIYRRKFDAKLSDKISFVQALSFAAGKLEGFGAMPEGIYLADYKFDSETSTYTFYYNYKLNQLAVARLSSKDYPITIVVREGQVVSIDKNVKSFAGAYVLSGTPIERLATIDDCIYNNMVELSVYYLQDKGITNPTESVFDQYYPMISEIKSIELTYIEQKTNDGLTYMQPTWQLRISDRIYLFNAYDSKLIKTYKY